VKFNKVHSELKEFKLNMEVSSKKNTLHNISNPKKNFSISNNANSLNFSKKDVSGCDEQFLQKAQEIIEKNMQETDFSTEKFCKEIGISRAHLHRKLKALADQSATEFIRTIKLKRAAELLNRRTASVSEIAYNTGFNNLSYFSRCFKEEFGIVPSEYSNNSNSCFNTEIKLQ
jgi:AraC-like DNA-binding protein